MDINQDDIERIGVVLNVCFTDDQGKFWWEVEEHDGQPMERGQQTGS